MRAPRTGRERTVGRRNSPVRLALGLTAILLLPSATLPVAASDDGEPLRLRAQRLAGPASSRAAVAEYSLRPDVRALAAGPGRLVVDLPGGARLEIERGKFTRRAPGEFLWEGTVAGGGAAILTGGGGSLAGLIYGPRSTWEIVPSRGGHRLVEVDPSRFPPCAGVPESSGGGKATEEPVSLGAADGSQRIDVMVLYDPDVKAAYGGRRPTQTQVRHLVDLTNVAYKNSNVLARVRLVHTQEIELPDDVASNGAHLSWLRTDPGVRALRDEHGADLVGLIYDRSAGFCGSAAMVFRPGQNGAAQAVFDVDRACGGASMTFAHEVGHLQGCDHNPEDARSEPTADFPDSFGHYHDGLYRSVMSYDNPCTGPCPALPFFSNPNVRHDGRLTGIRGSRNNARVIRETAELVAGFRPAAAGADCSLPPGHEDYCTECGPCSSGEGDCDQDADCRGELACAEGAGADFGLGAETDVCAAAGPCPVDPGDRDFCRLCGPCAFGEGDCDLDRECQAGLTCAYDVGEEYGEAPYIDVCAHDPGSYCPLPPGHPDYCTACGPCEVGEGNCKSNTECDQTTLECAEGLGPAYGYPADTNVCVIRNSGGECPLDVGHFNYCSACGRCGLGEGDCDGDRQCAAGLVCADGAGAEFDLDADTDICVEAAALAAPKRLRAKVLSPTEVRLRWRDKSDGEDSFQVQRKRAGKRRFKKAATVGANVKRVVIEDLVPGRTYTFRVRARSGSTSSGFSNEVTVTLPGS